MAWLFAPRGPLAGAERSSVMDAPPSAASLPPAVAARVPAAHAGAAPPTAPAPRVEPGSLAHASGDEPDQRFELREDEGLLRRVAALGAPQRSPSPFGEGGWGSGGPPAR